MKKSLLALLFSSFLIGLAPEVFAAETVVASKKWELPIFKKKKGVKLSRAAAAKKYTPMTKKKKRASSKPKRTW